MTEKPILYLIYEDLTEAVKNLGVEVFLGRPKLKKEELMAFIAVDLPTEIKDRVAGGSGVMVDGYGIFSIYCKAKSDRTLNVGAQSTLISNVESVFPINGEHITATNPRILMQGEDGYGYQVTDITFRLRTKFNAKRLQNN